MATLKYEKRQAIIAQALREIQFARSYKQGKVKNWQLNEDLYYGRKVSTENARANVDLGRMAEFVHTLLSKIDNPLTFKFIKRKESQMKRVRRLNSLRMIDQQKDDWDIKDLVGKKQAAIYGRAVYSYHADSYEGYCSHLTNIDVYDFLIDPSAGGLDMEPAMFLGDYGVVLTKSDLKEGAKSGLYLRTETQTLIDGAGNATEQPQETSNQNNRTSAQHTTLINKQIADPDKFKFWRWGTTFEGKRYYLLLSETGGTAIRVVPLEEVFKSGLWWYWSWAAFPDLTEFWTPSYADYVREIFMAQAVSINQMLDNAEQINKPQKVVNVGAIENLAELKYQRGGNNIKVKRDFDVQKAIQFVQTPSIDTPIKVFELLETIQEKASGVNATAKGLSDEDKVGIYEGNQANTADRFGLLNKSYSFGYKRFAKLYEHGVREHLIKRVAVDIIGPDGVEIEEVNRRDIFRKDDEFAVMVEASNAEIAMSEVEKRNKIAFLSAQALNPKVNAQKAFGIQAQIAGFTEEEIRQLLDTSDFGDAELMSEAERDLEALLDGKVIQPNQAATTAYKQRFVDYLMDNQEDISPEDAERIFAYVDQLEPVIIRNMARKAQEAALRMQLDALKAAPTPSPTGPPVGPAPATPPTEPTIITDTPNELTV